MSSIFINFFINIFYYLVFKYEKDLPTYNQNYNKKKYKCYQVN